MGGFLSPIFTITLIFTSKLVNFGILVCSYLWMIQGWFRKLSKLGFGSRHRICRGAQPSFRTSLDTVFHCRLEGLIFCIWLEGHTFLFCTFGSYTCEPNSALVRNHQILINHFHQCGLPLPSSNHFANQKVTFPLTSLFHRVLSNRCLSRSYSHYLGQLSSFSLCFY